MCIATAGGVEGKNVENSLVFIAFFEDTMEGQARKEGKQLYNFMKEGCKSHVKLTKTHHQHSGRSTRMNF